ncbi:OmpH family outer membrane protein [Candidatus Pelagibacter sp.]|nr:OmpH family outer membrane protein [Candidatus Pelagibacter sp.]
MKKIFLLLFFIFFNFNFAAAEINLAFIDFDKVLSTSKPGLSIINQLDDINSKNENKLISIAEKLKKQETELIAKKNVLSETEFQSSVKKLKLKIKEYNDNRNEINNDFNKLKIDNTNKLLKLINPILINYSNEKSISLILNKKNLIIGKAEFDITDEIIKIIDKQIQQFKIE